MLGEREGYKINNRTGSAPTHVLRSSSRMAFREDSYRMTAYFSNTTPRPADQTMFKSKTPIPRTGTKLSAPMANPR